jgi:transcriptional regulator with XRE-family HTH domain
MYLADQSLLWRLPSAAMTAEEERRSRRLGYWLRMVREERGITLEDAAVAVGLSPKSGSTVSHWEHGRRPIKVQHLIRLARFYGVPEAFFTDPPMTDEERLEAALGDAARLEREDWDMGSGAGPGGAGGRGAGPRRHH